MKITYTKQGDYLIPNLVLENTSLPINLNKYGRMRLHFLKENKRTLYLCLLMKNQLSSHLEEVQKTSSQRIENLIQKLAKEENVTEELKVKNQMQWVGLMNNIKNPAEEIVLNEFIYI